MDKDFVLPIGKWDFESILDSNNTYIDKTEHISTLIKCGSDVIFYTRPRRFGKSLFLTTLQSFFDIKKDSSKYFEGLKISKDKDAYFYMNKFPVIYLTLQNIYSDTFNDAYEKLESLISNLFQSFSFLMDDEIYPEQKERFLALRQKKAIKSNLLESLLFLSELLFNHYGEKVILLIDEYDVPLAKADQAGYYSEMIGIIRELFTCTLKSNPYLRKAVLTGCLRVSKESIFTGLNNLKVYSLTDASFSSAFGFTEEEVSSLLSMSGLEDKAEKVRTWYDGYKIGNDKIYCPWDVVQYITDALVDREKEPDNYWANTSENSVITRLVEISKYKVADDYRALIRGESISKRLKNDLTYGSLYKTADNLWTLLFQTGYLTLKDRYNPQGLTELVIPNEEVRNTFISSIEAWSEEKKREENHGPFYKALWDGNVEKLNKLISGHIRKSISFYDYDETFYHGLLLGFFFDSPYIVKSNRETGDGRADISIIDLEKRRVAIIELKKSEKIEDLEKDAKRAIKQAIDNHYKEEFGSFSTILYGIAFCKKYMLLEKED